MWRCLRGPPRVGPLEPQWSGKRSPAANSVRWRPVCTNRTGRARNQGGAMKRTFRLLLVGIAIGGALTTAEAQPLQIKVGYTALAGSFTPLWIAKELDLFERQGIQCSPIYMPSTLAYQAMLDRKSTRLNSSHLGISSAVLYSLSLHDALPIFF